MILADALVTALREIGAEFVFGVGGANIEHIYDAVHRLGDGKLKSVLAKREDGAAFMADGLARVHRRLGVCCATSGGGMMNLVAGLAESLAESVPVLALVGQPPTGLAGAGAFQDSSGIGRTVDAEGLLRAVTKDTVHLPGGPGFWPVLGAAVGAALGGRPGPVAVLLPRDAMTADVPPMPAGWVPALLDAIRPRPVPRDELAGLDARLRAARSPVLLLGHGVRRSPGGAAVAEFAGRIGVPVAVTMGARGEFPAGSPLFLGVLGVAGNPSVADYVRTRADLVVAVGTGISVMTRSPVPDWPAHRTVAVNIDAAATSWQGIADVVVHGDAGEVFVGLEEFRAADPFTVGPDTDYVRTRFVPRPAPGADIPGEGILTQSSAVRVIDRFTEPETHTFFDAGNCAVAAMHYSEVPAGGTSTIALGMGGMGYAFGAAIGAQLGARPNTRTVAFCGDGAFLMSGTEIHTAAELGVPVLYIVFNNGMHGMCVTRQDLYFGGRREAVGYRRPGIAEIGRALAGPDRLWTATARTTTELEAALATYAAGPPRPGVLELVLDHEEIPPFTPFLDADEPTEAAGPVRSGVLAVSR